MTALHINGCSGDLNPLPRRKVELMEEYGDEMAASVASAALTPTVSSLTPIGPDQALVCSAVEIPLRYHTLPTREELIRTRDDPKFFAPCMLPTGESDCFPSVLSGPLLSMVFSSRLRGRRVRRVPGRPGASKRRRGSEECQLERVVPRQVRLYSDVRAPQPPTPPSPELHPQDSSHPAGGSGTSVCLVLRAFSPRRLQVLGCLGGGDAGAVRQAPSVPAPALPHLAVAHRRRHHLGRAWRRRYTAPPQALSWAGCLTSRLVQ